MLQFSVVGCMEGFRVQELHVLLGIDDVGMVEGKLLHTTRWHQATLAMLNIAAKCGDCFDPFK